MGILKLTTQAMEEANAQPRNSGWLSGRRSAGNARLKENNATWGLSSSRLRFRLVKSSCQLSSSSARIWSAMVRKRCPASARCWIGYQGILSLVVVWQQMATAAAFGASVVKAALTGNLSEVKRLYEAYAELSDEHAAAMRKAVG